MGSISARRSDAILAKTGHNAHDSYCSKWRGDFAGVNLQARCKICRPEPEKKSFGFSVKIFGFRLALRRER